MKDRDAKKFENIVKTIELVMSYCEKETLNTFLSNNMLSDACAMRILVLAEDASQISTDCQRLYPQVNWGSIRGLRNRIAHDYFGIDFEILWEIIQNDLPLLKSQITEILVSFNKPSKKFD